MKTRTLLAKIFVIAGVVMIGLTLLAPVAFGVVALIRSGHFTFDYLLPAEFFLVVLAGGVLILAAAILAKKRVKETAWLFGIYVLMLAALMIVPVVTGLASGDTQPVGVLGVVAAALIILYWLSIFGLLIAGKYLGNDLLVKKHPADK